MNISLVAENSRVNEYFILHEYNTDYLRKWKCFCYIYSCLKYNISNTLIFSLTFISVSCINLNIFVDQNIDLFNTTIDMNISSTLISISRKTIEPKLLFNEARGTLQEINIGWVKDLTPRKNVLYHANKKYKKITLIFCQRG